MRKILFSVHITCFLKTFIKYNTVAASLYCRLFEIVLHFLLSTVFCFNYSILHFLTQTGRKKSFQIYSTSTVDVRGVLGNKCAVQHNLKTVHFRDTLASGNFWAWSSAVCVFFSALYLPQDGGSKLLCNDGGCDPLQALLEGALDHQAACQL